MTADPKALKQEAAAWRRLAEWCAEGDPARRTFLCDRLDKWDPSGGDTADRIPNMGRARPKMQLRLQAHANASCAASGELHAVLGEVGRARDYWWARCPFTKRNDARVLFCELMAHECLDEDRHAD